MRPAVDIWMLQPGKVLDAVALTQTATFPLYVRSIQRRRNRVEVIYPDGSCEWLAARELVLFNA